MIRTLLVAALLASSTAAVMAQGQNRSGTPEEQKACSKDVSRYCRSVMDQSDLVIFRQSKGRCIEDAAAF
jgi:hypothetical protein